MVNLFIHFFDGFQGLGPDQTGIPYYHIINIFICILFLHICVNFIFNCKIYIKFTILTVKYTNHKSVRYIHSIVQLIFRTLFILQK